ncbi:MAG: PepSY-associated TM helix domain-containing protein [Prolixibacteraceae bacterium]|nr:PepSY-associated TM helix domain-containing protein [Prolixibacteraceae bacterium]
MKIRKFLRNWHRDLGYFSVGILTIYCVSGIYLNHRYDFNPDYKIYYQEFKADIEPKESYSKEEIREILSDLDYDVLYKKHYMANNGNIKVFIESGEVEINPNTGLGAMRYLQRRPLIYGMNHLHKASIIKTWKWVSDFLAIIILFVTISGLFILKGKFGLKGRGWWLTLAGILVPLFFMIFYI